MKHNKQQGFTLIELLVVVVIIGILSAVALPPLTKAVNKARVAKVKPVLKSISDAWDVYFLGNPDTSCGAEECLERLDIALPEDSDFTFYLDEVVCGTNGGSCGAVIVAENDKMNYKVEYISAGYDGGGSVQNNIFKCDSNESGLCSKLGAKYDNSNGGWLF